MPQRNLEKQVPALLAVPGCTLTELCDVDTVKAMELLDEIGDPCRFLTEVQFARWRGGAPRAEEDHGRAHRHRLDRGTNRKINSVLHIVHVTQVRCHDPARSFMARKINANMPRRSARALTSASSPM
ncbi:transposase [Streptomyces kronopolitis]|uniref:transposase n=1 Tax=Streptomyces kronopolitis TaxID=1612435 RepID=UPI0036940823